jgi:glycosyltransferase involved in cell wall biosynthesis
MLWSQIKKEKQNFTRAADGPWTEIGVTSDSAKPIDVNHLLNPFPAPSQRFILRELRALTDLGVRLRIYVLRRLPTDWLEPEDGRWLSQTVFVPFWISWAVLRAHLYFIRRQPRRYMEMVFLLLAMPRRRWNLVFRILHAILLAPFVAHDLRRSGRSTHLHAHFSGRATETAIGAARLLSGSFSFTAHAHDIYATANALPEKIRSARFVVTCTLANAKYLRGLCPDVPAEQIRLIYHGVEARTPLGLPVTVLRQRGEAAPLLLTAGRLVAKKGFDVLVETCAVLRSRRIAFHCLVVGDGPLKQELERQVLEAGLQEAVQLVGWKNFEELVELYRATSVFILPSRVTSTGDRDGIPNVLLEALLFEVPVVTTSVSAIPELIVDGVTGLIVPPDRPGELAICVETLLRDKELARRLAAAGRRKVEEEFDSRTNTARLVALYCERTGPAGSRFTG